MLDRYTIEPMMTLFSEESKFKLWLEVELAVLKAKVKMNILPAETYEKIKTSASFDLKRIKDLEEIYQHDMIAFIVSVQESLETAGHGDAKEELHKGITSYDIEDPAMILLIRKALNEIIQELEGLIRTTANKALEHKWTFMMARTHGQFAEPSTFGHLLKVAQAEFERSLARLRIVLNNDLIEGKISGAVGVYGGIDPMLEKLALEELGLIPAKAETQILQRDRHASLLSNLAILGGSIERSCRTFWEMMRSDVGELQEPRKSTQRGSSAMPQKRNPILTERLLGLPRLLRAYAHAAMENIATPEGRDISQSSVERHIIPDSLSLTHYMIIKFKGLVQKLVVFPEKMFDKIIKDSMGTWAAQRVRMALMDSGIPYDEAYQFTQKMSFLAMDEKVHLFKILKKQSHSISSREKRTAKEIIGLQKLQTCFNPIEYVRVGIEKIFQQ